jgi:hypothetical protein
MVWKRTAKHGVTGNREWCTAQRRQDDEVETRISVDRGKDESSVLEELTAGERMKLVLLDSLIGNDGRMTAKLNSRSALSQE